MGSTWCRFRWNQQQTLFRRNWQTLSISTGYNVYAVFTFTMNTRNSTRKKTNRFEDHTDYTTFGKTGYDEDDIDTNLHPSSLFNVDSDARNLGINDVDTNHHVHSNHNMYNSTGSSAPHKLWKIICDDNLEPHKFHSLIKGVTLHDDSKQKSAEKDIQSSVPCWRFYHRWWWSSEFFSEAA